MDKELINAKFLNIESWAYRARHQVEYGNTENIMIATERIKQGIEEIDTLIAQGDILWQTIKKPI